jgi:hypothetical protein
MDTLREDLNAHLDSNYIPTLSEREIFRTNVEKIIHIFYSLYL